jgi:hypothetical protein
MSLPRFELNRHEYIHFVEASMHSRFGPRNKQDGFFEKWGFGFVILPVLLAIAMIALSVFEPKNSNWIADSVQAEFGGKSVKPAPTPETKPPTQTRTVDAK